MISRSSLRGYVLEELLAALLKTSGYDLLVDATQDPSALVMAGNGLRIRGRGADHQVDVLGQLRYRIPFMHRLRLFLEAKYRSDPVGLGDVRNALGVINDVNEHFSWATKQSSPGYVRYHYRYALFSATGFTTDAQRFAITQQISLVDLSGPAFSWLLRAADRVAAQMLRVAEASRVEGFPVAQVREALRRALGTWPAGPGEEDSETFAETAGRAMRSTTTTSEESSSLPRVALARVAAEAAEAVDQGRELYLAFTDAPFLLLVQPDEPDEANDFFRSRRNESVHARLTFGGRSPQTGEWVLTATDGYRALNFRMALPSEFEAVVLGAEPQLARGILGARERFVTLAVDDGDAELTFDALTELGDEFDFDKGDASSGAGADPADRAPRDYRRATVLAPELAFQGDDDQAQELWPRAAVEELLRRLRVEHWPHADIIEFAARQGGSVTREQVYEVAGYPPDRMLRGFTRPTRRIARALVREGLLPRDARPALATQYSSGVLATHFNVPPEFVRLIPSLPY